MTLTLDSDTEQRIQREIDLGHYRYPADVVAHAVSLLDEKRNSLPSTEVGLGPNATGTPGEHTDARRKAIDAAFGLWAHRKEDGLAYQHRMRDEW